MESGAENKQPLQYQTYVKHPRYNGAINRKWRVWALKLLSELSESHYLECIRETRRDTWIDTRWAGGAVVTTLLRLWHVTRDTWRAKHGCDVSSRACKHRQWGRCSFVSPPSLPLQPSPVWRCPVELQTKISQAWREKALGSFTFKALYY